MPRHAVLIHILNGFSYGAHYSERYAVADWGSGEGSVWRNSVFGFEWCTRMVIRPSNSTVLNNRQARPLAASPKRCHLFVRLYAPD